MAKIAQFRAARRLAQVFAAALFCFLSCAQTLAQSEQEDDIAWQDNDGLVIVIGDAYVNIYTAPGRGYPIFHIVEKHQKLRIIKSRTNWYKVESDDGKLGWVRRKDLVTVYDEAGALIDFSIPKWNDEARPWHFGLLAGTINGTISYSLISGYRFTENISTEVKFSQAFGDFSNIKIGTISVMHQPFPEWRVSPFFALGVGRVRTFPSAALVATEDREDSVMVVSGGISYFATHNLAFRMEYNKHVVLTTRENNEEVEEWKAGFSVLF